MAAVRAHAGKRCSPNLGQVLQLHLEVSGFDDNVHFDQNRRGTLLAHD
jgi:hypothetical protein